MGKRGEIRSWCNPRPGWSREAQLERLTGEVYEADSKDKGARKRASLIKSVRRENIVEVCELYLLALDIGNAKKQRNDLMRAVDEIEAKPHYGVVVEVSTGYRSDNPAQWRRMWAEAYVRLGAAGRGRKSAVNGRRSKGRPKKWVLTPEQDRLGKAIWHDRTLKNDDQRCVALHRELGMKLKRGWCRTRWGSPHEAPSRD